MQPRHDRVQNAILTGTQLEMACISIEIGFEIGYRLSVRAIITDSNPPPTLISCTLMWWRSSCAWSSLMRLHKDSKSPCREFGNRYENAIRWNECFSSSTPLQWRVPYRAWQYRICSLPDLWWCLHGMRPDVRVYAETDWGDLVFAIANSLITSSSAILSTLKQ